MRKRLITLSLLGIAALVLYAQSASDTASDIRVNVTNIVVPVGVYDRDGNVVCVRIAEAAGVRYGWRVLGPDWLAG